MGKFCRSHIEKFSYIFSLYNRNVVVGELICDVSTCTPCFITDMSLGITKGILMNADGFVIVN